MDDPLGGFKPGGALLECIELYYGFDEDLEILVREGYLRVTGPETCEWLKSKTSLAEYFKWTDGDARWVSGGFWAPIENAFGIKRHTLRKLAGNNANYCKPDESRDFIKIKKILQKRRRQVRVTAKEKRVYDYIRMLILVAKDEEDVTIDRILKKIYAIINKNVDKNIKKRR